MNKKWIGGGVATVVALVFGYYALSPLLRVVRVNDAVPPASAELSKNNESMKSGVATVSIGGVPVMGTPAHPASGTARIISSEGKNYVRYENFKTLNGPDIYVYLAKDLDAKEYVSLGRVRATEGNINYEIPAGVNPKDYKYVLTWCRTFEVLFNSATIN